MCTISINSYDWDSSESEGKRPKPTPLPHMIHTVKKDDKTKISRLKRKQNNKNVTSLISDKQDKKLISSKSWDSFHKCFQRPVTLSSVIALSCSRK